MQKNSYLGFFLGILMTASSLLALNTAQIEKIGRQIWQNEASGKEELLVFWNKNESFPSLGIGHNIWYPKNHAWFGANDQIKYTQGFPLLCNYLKEHGVKLPAWLEEALKTGAPWQTREQFYQDEERLQQLRQMLVNTIELQTEFMINLFEKKRPLLLAAAPSKQRKKLQKNLDLLHQSPAGMYALIDYLNFKGDGLNSQEAIGGQRWGLLAVLLAMPDNLNQQNAVRSFAACAAQKLMERIVNSAPDYKPLTFLNGWMKRVSTYIEYV